MYAIFSVYPLVDTAHGCLTTVFLHQPASAGLYWMGCSAHVKVSPLLHVASMPLCNVVAPFCVIKGGGGLQSRMSPVAPLRISAKVCLTSILSRRCVSAALQVVARGMEGLRAARTSPLARFPLYCHSLFHRIHQPSLLSFLC